MTRKRGNSIEGLTRRNALKTGAAVTSGLAFGGAAIGTVAATDMVAETDNVMPVHEFVRAEGDDDGDGPFVDPTAPHPDDDDLLVERRKGHPVDDGTVHDELDGDQLTWAEFSDIEGAARIKCNGDDPWTEVELEVEGLIPNGLYTAWVVVFAEDDQGRGFIDDRNLSIAFQNLSGVGSLGENDGSENVFRADDEGEGEIEANHPDGDLSIFGTVGNCLLEEFEVHFVGALHMDDKTHGPIPEPRGKGSLAEQFSFMWVDGKLK